MQSPDGVGVVRCADHRRWIRMSEGTPQRIEFPGGPVITRYRCVGDVQHFDG